MGYNIEERDEIRKIISTECTHQTNLDDVGKHYDFARPSFKLSQIAIDVLRADNAIDNPIALDVGSAGGPTSQLLSENGFDTYRCDLDPNSLFSGLHWKHKNLIPGKNIVCDSKWLPFPTGALDVVFCKELVHHIADFQSFFLEINRILKPGGTFVLIEPSISLRSQIGEALALSRDDHYGHHYQTTSEYLQSLMKLHFSPYRYFVYNYRSTAAVFQNAVPKNAKQKVAHLRIKMLFQRVFGGSNVFFLRKNADLSRYEERPRIEIVDADCLTLGDEFLEDDRLLRFHEILNEVSQELSSEGVH
jgi:SAM-dependent methyltransferase